MKMVVIQSVYETVKKRGKVNKTKKKKEQPCESGEGKHGGEEERNRRRERGEEEEEKPQGRLSLFVFPLPSTG